jgi:hypothetical protein
MKKLIIHIGYPKTATSSLQLNMFTQLMKENKIEYLNHLGRDDENLGKISVKNMVSTVLGFNAEINYTDEINQLLQINKAITVLSSESLSHVCENSQNADYKIGAIENAEKLKTMFLPYFDSIEIIMGIREQKSMITSYFIQEYFNIINHAPDLSDRKKWIDLNFGKNRKVEELIFNYYEMYLHYIKSFGKNNVHILVYEDLLHDKDFYYQKLGSILNFPKNDIQNLLEKKIINRTAKTDDNRYLAGKKTLGLIISEKMKKISKQSKNMYKIYNKNKKIIKSILPEKFLNLKVGEEKIIEPLTKEEINLINERFQSSNRKLIEVAGLSAEKMRKYGYID